MRAADLPDFDVSEFLGSELDIEAYMNEVLEDGDPTLLQAALGDIARARGMSRLAQEAGISRDALCEALSATDDPSFATIHRIIGALGLRLRVVAAK